MFRVSSSGGGGEASPPQIPKLPPKKERRKGERERERREKRREEKRERERGRGSDGEMQTERITAIIIIETQITLDSYMTVLYRITLRGFCSSIELQYILVHRHSECPDLQ